MRFPSVVLIDAYTDRAERLLSGYCRVVNAFFAKATVHQCRPVTGRTKDLRILSPLSTSVLSLLSPNLLPSTW